MRFAASSVNGKTLLVKVLTHQERFAVTSLVNGKTSKKSMAKRHNSPCFFLNNYMEGSGSATIK